MMGDNYLTVHAWDRDFNPYRHEIASTIVWARLLDIPIHYFNTEAVMKIGKRIGKPIRVDQATSTGAHLDYARVCVQVDLTKPLLSKFKINGVKYFIQYEGLEKICLECGRYFDRTKCACKVPPEDMETDKGSVPEKPKQAEPETHYGDWMIGKKRNRTNRKDSNPQSGKGQSNSIGGVPGASKGSRFNVLQVDDELVDDLSSSQEVPGSRF
ncbi:unnamed protein product [Linum tenue]|nr:unnamed protein product [Linum tenue]